MSSSVQVTSYQKQTLINPISSPEVISKQSQYDSIQETLYYIFRVSKALATEDAIKNISKFVSSRLSLTIGSLNPTDQERVALVNMLYPKIVHFFKIASHCACLILSELIHAVHLIDRLIDSDLENRKLGKSTLIRESNLGTLLLCGIIISIKYNRDIPFTNLWWASNIGVAVGVINKSELVFLDNIHYDVSLHENRYMDFFTMFVKQD